jgi:3-oxoacyl-(acyl-carrier-protein) synthase
MKVFITGFGCISPIGLNFEETLSNLRSEKDGIDKSNFLNSRYASLKYFGEVKSDTQLLKKILHLENSSGFTRTDLLAMMAFRDAVENAGLTHDEISSRETAFISASTVGGMCNTDDFYKDSNLKSDSTEYVNSYPFSRHTLRIVSFYGIKGFTDTINTACSSSSNAIMIGLRLIQSGRTKRAIVGGAESLSKFTVNGFNSLQILAEGKCKPFDSNRDGLNLGEGAAYLVLEAEDCCKKKLNWGKMAGAGNSNDAFHHSALSDNATGVIKCMQLALKDANISSGQISYINAHGTGTQNNDQVELSGFSKTFPVIPPFCSTKSYTGHTLAASGAIEAVFCLLSMKYNELYPNLHTINPIDGCGNSLIRKYIPGKEINYVMSNAYGFGGNCTSLIFAKS